MARLLEKYQSRAGSLGRPFSNYSCDICGVAPIPAGLMYQCLTCRPPADDGGVTTFDLCSSCYDASATGCPNGRHRMVCYSSVPDTPVSFVDPPSDDDDDTDGDGDEDGYDSAEIVIDDSDGDDDRSADGFRQDEDRS